MNEVSDFILRFKLSVMQRAVLIINIKYVFSKRSSADHDFA